MIMPCWFVTFDLVVYFVFVGFIFVGLTLWICVWLASAWFGFDVCSLDCGLVFNSLFCAVNLICWFCCWVLICCCRVL